MGYGSYTFLHAQPQQQESVQEPPMSAIMEGVREKSVINVTYIDTGKEMTPAEVYAANSQFFIVHEDSTFPDGQYAAFGWVTEGMDIVDAICTEAEPTDDNGTVPAEQQPIITSVKIRTDSAETSAD